jgi:hypothetical protein
MTQQGSWALLPINDASNLLRKVTIWKGPEKKKKQRKIIPSASGEINLLSPVGYIETLRFKDSIPIVH